MSAKLIKEDMYYPGDLVEILPGYQNKVTSGYGTWKYHQDYIDYTGKVGRVVSLLRKSKHGHVKWETQLEVPLDDKNVTIFIGTSYRYNDAPLKMVFRI